MDANPQIRKLIMTREELRNKLKELDNQKRLLIMNFEQDEMELTKFLNKKVRCYEYNAYARSEDKVWTYRGDGYVSGASAPYFSVPFYAINKIKKDGTMSEVSAGYYNIAKVELIDE